jgi:hypothetical protein
MNQIPMIVGRQTWPKSGKTKERGIGSEQIATTIHEKGFRRGDKLRFCELRSFEFE